MQDQKSNLFTSSFNKDQWSLLKQIAVFFTPVIICYALLEISVLNIPMSYDKIYMKINTQENDIKVMVLGSSQMQAAVNPEFLDKLAINYGSTSQHHTEDNHIMEQSLDRFPNLETIVFELSYAHLELQHHGKNFWKNSIYLKYYGVNAFERRTYFKDRLIFLSSPSLYSGNFIDYYIKKKPPEEFNEFGYRTNNFDGAFSRANYDEDFLEKRKFFIRTTENIDVFANNTPFFYSMIRTALANDKKVVIGSLPTYKTYLKERNPNILRRRDSILNDIQIKFPEVKFLNMESDSITFGVKDYINENHLNARGAEKFTKQLNEVINN